MRNSQQSISATGKCGEKNSLKFASGNGPVVQRGDHRAIMDLPVEKTHLGGLGDYVGRPAGIVACSGLETQPRCSKAGSIADVKHFWLVKNAKPRNSKKKPSPIKR